MSILKTAVLGLFILLALNVASGAEASLNLVFSPWVAPAQREKQQGQVRSFLLRQAPAGVHVKLWDGWTAEMLGEAVVPALRYDNAAARAQNRDMSRLLAALNKWGEASQGSENELVGTGALRAPELLQEISGDRAVGTNTIVLIGSPIYCNVTEPSFSMTEGRYPSDGHLKCTLTESVYGVAQKQGRLNQVTVHWVIPNLAVWQNELHEQAVTRFWALFVQAQSGKLATFSADLPRVLQRALQTDLTPILSVQPEPSDEKPTMHSAIPRTVPNWLVQILIPPPAATPPPDVLPVQPPSVQAPTAPAPEPAPSPALVVQAPVVPPPAPVVGKQTPPLPTPAISLPMTLVSSKAGIGIAWSAKGVDLDLYVRAFPRASELYYNRMRSKEGFLYNDERNANAGRYYEFVEFKVPVDFSQTTAWVNYYGGSVANVTGQVVFFDHGQIKVGTFTLRATRGNRGGDSSSRERSAYWTEVRLTNLVETNAPLAAQKPGER